MTTYEKDHSGRQIKIELERYDDGYVCTITACAADISVTESAPTERGAKRKALASLDKA